MKKLIPVIALLVGVSSAFGQGVVNFRNGPADLPSPPDRLIRMPDMVTPVIGTTYAVQLFYGADSASLTPHPTLAYFRASLSAGSWSGANRTLNGVALPATPLPGTTTLGPQIWLQINVWDSGTGRLLTYDQARAAGALTGTTLFQYQQRASDPSDTADTQMRNFVGFSLVPEPSVIGLGLIGIGALFMLRRRKA